ncbi:MAG: hypothetical protein MZU97_05900 [Bacillus subtilis]|nr:hypothetical protein [Bacillus subtilis]
MSWIIFPDVDRRRRTERPANGRPARFSGDHDLHPQDFERDRDPDLRFDANVLRLHQTRRSDDLPAAARQPRF